MVQQKHYVHSQGEALLVASASLEMVSMIEPAAGVVITPHKSMDGHPA